jgi:hypothetical protein
MDNFIERIFNGRRSLQQALADMLRKYECAPHPELARTIEFMRAEIEFRKKSRPPASHHQSDTMLQNGDDPPIALHHD